VHIQTDKINERKREKDPSITRPALTLPDEKPNQKLQQTCPTAPKSSAAVNMHNC